MKYIQFIAMIALLAGAQGQSLEETIGLALHNNPLIQASEQHLASAELSERAANRKTLPKLEWNARAAYVSDVMELDLALVNPAANGSIRMGVNQSYGTSLEASYVLFSGYAQTAGVRISEKQRELAAIEVSSTRKKIAYRAATSYRNIQRQKLKIAALESAIGRADLQLQKVAALVDKGMALSMDTLTLSLAKLKFEQQLIALKAMQASAEDQLANLAGAAVNVTLSELPAVYELPDLMPSRLESLQALNGRIELTRESQVLKESKKYPSVAVQAAFNFGKPGVDYIADEWMPYGSLGLGLEWEIWNWGTTKAESQAQQARVKEIQYQQENLRRQVRLRYTSAVREYASIREQLAVFRTALQLAREKMRIITLQSEKGLVSATEFNDSNLELTQAELDYQEHLVQLAMQVLEIDYISGSPVSDWHCH